MRKIAVIIIIIISYVSLVSPVYCVAEESAVIQNWQDICKISVQSRNMATIGYIEYDFTTTDANEIIYITHFFNSLEWVESEHIVSAGAKSCWVVFESYDGVQKSFDLSPRGIIISGTHGYSIPSEEYYRFHDLIDALRTGKIVINDSVSFETSEWASEDVEKAIKNELVPKWNQIEYKSYITRLETCQLVNNFLEKQGLLYVSEEYKPYSDGDKSVVALYNANIVNGKTDTEFFPYDSITREEFAKVLCNTYHCINENSLSANEISFADKDDISDWAIEYVGEMVALGILEGDDSGCFRPKDSISKEEVIITLLRLGNLCNKSL